MKTKSSIITLMMALMIVCVTSCKNNGSAGKSDTDEKTENKTEDMGSTEKQTTDETALVPVLNVSELMEVYDSLEDYHYFEKHYASKNMKLIHSNDYKDVESLADADWLTEIWGHHITYDNSKELYEEGLTAEADDALAMVVNHTDDPASYIYFTNPAYKDIYLKQIEELGYKHFVGDDEYGNHYDLYAKDGYRFGDGGQEVFSLKQEKNFYVLRYAYEY